MRKTLTSAVLGTMTQDSEFDDWWHGEALPVPFLDGKEMVVTFTGFEPSRDASFVARADEALRQFLALTSADRERASGLVHRNCMEFLDAIGYDEDDDALWNIENPNDIWAYVYPTHIYLSRRHRRDGDIYVRLTCNCEWEREHGLQLVFRQGRQLTRVSAEDGHLTEADAHDKPDAKDELLSAFDPH